MKKSRQEMPLNIVGGHENRDLQFWRDKSPQERIDAIEFLRTQHYCLSGYQSVPRFVHTIQIRVRHP